MTILQWNCRGYRSNYGDLRNLLQIFNPTIVCLQESMLGTCSPRPPGGYSLHCYSPTGNPVAGDGLVTLIRDDVPASKLALNTVFQATAHRVGTNRPTTICNLYIHPNELFNSNDFVQLIRQLPPPIILLGDVNSKSPIWGNTNDITDRGGHVIESILVNENLCLLNTGEATHITIQSGITSAIDLTLCSPALLPKLTWKVLDDTYGSDHFPIIVEDEDNTPVVKTPHLIVKKADWAKFYHLTVVNMPPGDIQGRTVDELVEWFNDHVMQAASAAMPLSSSRVMPRRVPWWTDECTVVNNERKQALRRYQRTRLVADKISYNRARARAIVVKNRARRESWKAFVSKLTVDTPMTKIWSQVQKMTGKYKQRSTPCIKSNNIIITDNIEVANKLADQYEHISSGANYSHNFIQQKQQLESRHLDFSAHQQYPYNDPISEIEVIGMLKQCKKTAPGEDGIHYEMLEKSHPTLLLLLLAIYNKVWNAGIYPCEWKRAIVLSFLKPGKPSDDVTSYRPIALTSCVGKLLEKIINARLMNVLELNGVLSKYQFGFRRMHSAIDSLTRLASDITYAFQRKEHAVCVFFDMEKAYDTAWRHGIVRTLHEAGIRGRMATYIRSFLSSRVFRTKVGENFSSERDQLEGVPQGSVLSCTLFALAINGISHNLPQDVKYNLYVDDFVLYSTSNYIPALERRLQVAINRVAQWSEYHGFKFSMTKTVAVHFNRKRGMQQEPSLLLQNQPIQFKEHKQFLGLTLDKKLKFDKHISYLKEDCTRRLNILRCIAHSNWGADRTTMLRIYRAMIRSKLDYGCTIYSSAKPYILERLDPVHNAAIRLSIGAFRSSPVLSLYAESGEPPLRLRRMQLMLQQYARMQQLPGSGVHSSLDPLYLTAGETFNARVMGTMQELSLTPANIMPFQHTDVPMWRMKMETVCQNYTYCKKSNASPNAMKQTFLEHVHSHHSNQIMLFTDGSKDRGNVGCAALLRNNIIKRKLNENSTIFTAELYAILDALLMIHNSQSTNFIIFSDSRSVLHAIQIYNSSHPVVVKIMAWLVRLAARQKVVQLCWVPSHVGIEQNEKADKEANIVANSQSAIFYNTIPHKDYYAVYKRTVKSKWQEEWQNITGNKLRSIKETTSEWQSSYQKHRKHQIILTRLRIGHTLLTHRYLMESGRPPYCGDCLVPLTVRHILAECPSYRTERLRHFPALAAVQGEQEQLNHMLAENRASPYEWGPLNNYIVDVNIFNKI